MLSLSPSQNPLAVDTPGIDFLSFVFEGGHAAREETQNIYIDAEDPTRTLNLQQTRTLVRKLIAGWRASGLESGDCVLLALGNNLLYSSIYFSVIGAGGVYIGVNPASQVFELNHILELARPKFIITSNDVLPTLLQTSQGTAYSSDQIFVLDAKSFPLSLSHELPPSPPHSQDGSIPECEPKPYSDFGDLTTCGESDWIRFCDEQTAKLTPAAMFSTSGTSGLPKAAISSHYALVCQHMSMEATPLYDVSRLISLPFFHVFAALFAHVWPVRNAQPLYILPRFQPEQYLDAIRRFRITDTVMAPPIVHTLNKSSMPLSELLDTIRWLGIGGAPIATEAMQEFESHLHPTATLTQVWGMTEIGVATLVSYPERHCWGSIGRPLPGFELRIMDSFGGAVVADHEPGSLQVRYHGMMTGYKDREPHPEGAWYDTGDIMTRVDGKYFVVGRSKELIKVNGWQVAPAELEAVLLTHPCIRDVGVIGSLKEDGVTEAPRAYVVRKSEIEGRCSSLTTEEVYKYSRERLASYKALNGGIFFVDYIPRTASGKIQRFKLAQMDQYRHSVTELLVRNNSVIAEQKRGKIAELKAQAEEARLKARRSSRLASLQPKAESSENTAKATKSTYSRRRSRNSLVNRLKALEASRSVLGRVTVETG